MDHELSHPIKNKLQNDVLECFNDYFYHQNNSRGILSACCGFGKTLTTYKIIKKCIDNGDRLFIIATSRTKLLNQLCNEFDRFFRKDKMNPLIKKLGDNSSIIEEDIANIINDDYKQVIIFITTYNSSKKIVNGISKSNKENENSINPDLIILDEAHNTTGEKEKYHQTLIRQLDDFSSDKYLFMTATPLRLLHKNKKSELNNDQTIFSMNNESLYGKIFYEYTFNQGFKDEILTPFTVIFFKRIDNTDIPEDLKKDIKDKSKEEKSVIYFREISKFLLDSADKYKFKKTIVYLSNKKNVELLKEILKDFEALYHSSKNLLYNVCTVTSYDTIPNKKKEENKFINSNLYSILLSVGIYNEGVDMPSVDNYYYLRI